MFSFSFLSNRSLFSCLFHLNTIWYKWVKSSKWKFIYQYIKSLLVFKGINTMGKRKRDCLKQALLVIYNISLTMCLGVVRRCVIFIVWNYFWAYYWSVFLFQISVLKKGHKRQSYWHIMWFSVVLPVVSVQWFMPQKM